MFETKTLFQSHHRNFLHILQVAFHCVDTARSARKKGDLAEALAILDEGLEVTTALPISFLDTLHMRTLNRLLSIFPSADKYLAASAILSERARIHQLCNNPKAALKQSRLAMQLHLSLSPGRLDPRYSDHHQALCQELPELVNQCAEAAEQPPRLYGA